MADLLRQKIVKIQRQCEKYIVEIRVFELIGLQIKNEYIYSVELYFKSDDTDSNKQSESFYDKLILKHHSKDLLNDVIAALSISFDCAHFVKFDASLHQFRFQFMQKPHIVKVTKSISFARKNDSKVLLIESLNINPKPLNVEIKCVNWNEMSDIDYEITMDIYSGDEYSFYIPHLFNNFPIKIYAKDYKSLRHYYETKLRNFIAKCRIFYQYLAHLKEESNCCLIKEWRENECESGAMLQLKHMLCVIDKYDHTIFSRNYNIFDLCETNINTEIDNVIINHSITQQTICDFISLSIKGYFEQKQIQNISQNERNMFAIILSYLNIKQNICPSISGLFSSYIDIDDDLYSEHGVAIDSLLLKQELIAYLHDEECPVTTRYWTAILHETSNELTFFIRASSEQILLNTQQYDIDFERLTFQSVFSEDKFTFVERNVYTHCPRGLIIPIVDNTFSMDWAIWITKTLPHFTETDGYWKKLHEYHHYNVPYKHLNAILKLLTHQGLKNIRYPCNIVFLNNNNNNCRFTNNDINAEYHINMFCNKGVNAALSLNILSSIKPKKDYLFIYFLSSMDNIDWIWWNGYNYVSYDESLQEPHTHDVMKQLECNYQALNTFPSKYHKLFNDAQIDTLSHALHSLFNIPFKPFILRFNIDDNIIKDIHQIAVNGVYDEYQRNVKRLIGGHNCIIEEEQCTFNHDIARLTVHIISDVITICIKLEDNYNFSCKIPINKEYECVRIIAYWRTNDLFTVSTKRNKRLIHQSNISLHDGITPKLNQNKCSICCDDDNLISYNKDSISSNAQYHDLYKLQSQKWDVLDELDDKHKPNQSIKHLELIEFWEKYHSPNKFVVKIFDTICLTKIQSIISMLKLYINDNTLFIVKNPIIIALSNNKLYDTLETNVNNNKSLSLLFDSDCTIKRIDGRGNIHNVFITNFDENIVHTDYYHEFIRISTEINWNTMMIFTRPKRNNIYIGYNGCISLLSLELNNEDLQYFLPQFIPLSKGSSVRIEALSIDDYGTIIDYTHTLSDIVYSIRCCGNVYYKLNYYQLFNKTPPKAYRCKRESLRVCSPLSTLWKSSFPIQNPSNVSHPFHSVFLAIIESTKQCIASIKSLTSHDLTIVEHQLQDCGIILLFYRTVINSNSNSNINVNDKLSKLMHYLKREMYITNIVKHQVPITYNDLCLKMSSILTYNNRVLLCHVIEHQMEIECNDANNENEDINNYDDAEPDSYFVAVEFDSDDDADNIKPIQTVEYTTKSTFECHIKYDFEMIHINQSILSIQDILSKLIPSKWNAEDHKLLIQFNEYNIYNEYDLEDKALIHKLKKKLTKEKEDGDVNAAKIYKKFCAFMEQFDSKISKHIPKKRCSLKQCINKTMEVTRNAMCLWEYIEQYKYIEENNDNTLIIAYNPLQTAVITSNVLYDVTHPIHLYRAAFDEHFYPQNMLPMLWSEWMLTVNASEFIDSERYTTIIKALTKLIDENRKYDVVLVPSSLTLDDSFLSDECQVIAPHYKAISEWKKISFLYKGNLYRFINQGRDDVGILLWHLHINTKKKTSHKISKLLSIGCGSCFIQNINGAHIVMLHTPKELQQSMFMNHIDCRIPYNEYIISDDKKCPICLSLQIKPSSIGNDECKHTFCQRCIQIWNQNKKSNIDDNYAYNDNDEDYAEDYPKCPLCRKKINQICRDCQKEIEMKESIPAAIHQQTMDENEARFLRLNAIENYYHEANQQELFETAYRNEPLR